VSFLKARASVSEGFIAVNPKKKLRTLDHGRRLREMRQPSSSLYKLSDDWNSDEEDDSDFSDEGDEREESSPNPGEVLDDGEPELDCRVGAGSSDGEEHGDDGAETEEAEESDVTEEEKDEESSNVRSDGKSCGDDENTASRQRERGSSLADDAEKTLDGFEELSASTSRERDSKEERHSTLRRSRNIAQSHSELMFLAQIKRNCQN